MAVFKNIGTAFLFTGFNDHIDICDTKYLPRNKSERSSIYTWINPLDWQWLIPCPCSIDSITHSQMNNKQAKSIDSEPHTDIWLRQMIPKIHTINNIKSIKPTVPYKNEKRSRIYNQIQKIRHSMINNCKTFINVSKPINIVCECHLFSYYQKQ